MRRKRPSERLYGTKQVAELLKIPDWRVKNFSEGGAYGLPPSQTVGTGRGSRRLYRESDVCRMAIANALVTFGFSPEAVGRAIRELPESLLTESFFDAPADEESEAEPYESRPVLVCRGGEWRLKKAGQAEDLVEEQMESPEAKEGLFILNLLTVLYGLVDKLRGELVPGGMLIHRRGGNH
jgi:hypothetical protein